MVSLATAAQHSLRYANSWLQVTNRPRDYQYSIQVQHSVSFYYACSWLEVVRLLLPGTHIRHNVSFYGFLILQGAERAERRKGWGSIVSGWVSSSMADGDPTDRHQTKATPLQAWNVCGEWPRHSNAWLQKASLPTISIWIDATQPFDMRSLDFQWSALQLLVTQLRHIVWWYTFLTSNGKPCDCQHRDPTWHLPMQFRESLGYGAPTIIYKRRPICPLLFPLAHHSKVEDKITHFHLKPPRNTHSLSSLPSPTSTSHHHAAFYHPHHSRLGGQCFGNLSDWAKVARVTMWFWMQQSHEMFPQQSERGTYS